MHDFLRWIDEVKPFETSSLERERSERIDQNASDGEGPKARAEPAFAYGNEGKHKDREVVGKTVTKLDPTAVLVEQVRHRYACRCECERPECRSSTPWPKSPCVNGRGQPKRQAMSVDLKWCGRASADEGQGREHDSEVFPKVMVGKQAPFVDATSPSDGQQMMSEFERIPKACVVVPHEDAQHRRRWQREQNETFAQCSNVQFFEVKGFCWVLPTRLDSFPEEEGKGETKWRTRGKSEAQGKAREYRVCRVGRCKEIKRGKGSPDDVSNEPDCALHCGKPVDRAEREEQRQADVFLFSTCTSRQTFEFV